MHVLLVTSDAGGVPLAVRQERDTIASAIGVANLSVIEQAKLEDLVRRLPAHDNCKIVHFSCHGSLDFKLKELVRTRCSVRGIALPPDTELSRHCADAIRRVLAERPPPEPVPLPLLEGEVLERSVLEDMEAGVVLHHAEDPPPNYEIVKPDGLAGLFSVCTALECVVLNACTSHLQGEEFLTQTTHVKHVISVRGRITDQAALLFSEGFYSALKRHPVENAFTHGCASLKARYGTAKRETMVEDEGGTPKLHSRPAAPAEPSEDRFKFVLSARVPRDDVDTKDALISYLIRTLNERGLPIRADEIQVAELRTTWQIILDERDGFVISRSEGERIVHVLNGIYALEGPARIIFGSIHRGSIILQVHSPVEIFSIIESDSRTAASKCAVLDGMRLRAVRPLGLQAIVIGSGITFARVSACATDLQLQLGLPEILQPISKTLLLPAGQAQKRKSEGASTITTTAVQSEGAGGGAGSSSEQRQTTAPALVATLKATGDDESV